MCLAIPGKVLEVSALDPAGLTAAKQDTALVDVIGVRRRVDLGLLQDDRPVPGDWVLIHVGFAMSKISEEDALDQMRILRMLGENEAAMQEVRGYSVDDAPLHDAPLHDVRVHDVRIDDVRMDVPVDNAPRGESE